jgi:capsular polysaccharide transport system permease protein
VNVPTAPAAVPVPTGPAEGRPQGVARQGPARQAMAEQATTPPKAGAPEPAAKASPAPGSPAKPPAEPPGKPPAKEAKAAPKPPAKEAKPAPKDAAEPAAPVPGTAPPAHLRRRHWWVIVSLVLIWLLPTLVTGWYLYARAADQYASRLGFTIRQEEVSSAVDLLGGLTALSSASSSDTDILYEFIHSQEMVRTADAELDIRRLYQKPEGDPVFALGPDPTIEDLLDYWRNVVHLSYAPGTGLMEVEVRAFDPDDARAVAQVILDRSSLLINDLSAIARDDATRYAREELDLAVERLTVARQDLTLFRNETQIVDVGADLQGQMGLLSSLQAQLAEALIALDLLDEAATGGSDPRVAQAERRIAVIERRIADERDKVGGDSERAGRPFADIVSEFERLQVNLQFAQEAYISALATYDSAVAEARRQSRYLAPYLEPTLAEAPEYPQRPLLVLLVSMFAFGLWAILTLIYYSLRDRR